MKFQVFFLLFFSTISLFAQSEIGVLRAKQLHERGLALLQNENVPAFDKLQALEQFQQTKKILDSTAIAKDSFYQKNEIALQNLTQYFTKNQNSDSLLQTSRFYPDSIFQVNSRYDSAFKSLITNYLTLKNSAAKIAFYQLKGFCISILHSKQDLDIL